jgi:hypothetical protein
MRGPTGAGNILNLINRYGPKRFMLADPGTLGSELCRAR